LAGGIKICYYQAVYMVEVVNVGDGDGYGYGTSLAG